MYCSIHLDTQPGQGRLLDTGRAHIYHWLHVGDFGAEGKSPGISSIDHHRGKCGSTTKSNAGGGGNILHDCWRHQSIDC